MSIFKQGTLLLVISLFCITFISQFGLFLHGMESIHTSIADHMSIIFSGSSIGQFIKETLALLIVPILIGVLPGLLYFAIKRRKMPYLLPIIWITWIMLATSLALNTAFVARLDSPFSVPTSRSV